MGHPCVSAITSRPKGNSREQDSSRRGILATKQQSDNKQTKELEVLPISCFTGTAGFHKHY